MVGTKIKPIRVKKKLFEETNLFPNCNTWFCCNNEQLKAQSNDSFLTRSVFSFHQNTRYCRTGEEGHVFNSHLMSSFKLLNIFLYNAMIQRLSVDKECSCVTHDDTERTWCKDLMNGLDFVRSNWLI